jgi:hypothetical protein
VADDRRRFYADPFPIVKDGRTYLFVEDFEHRLGRGVISAVAFDDSGPVGNPRPVLETEFHLSYVRLRARRRGLDGPREQRRPGDRALPRRAVS